MKNCLLRTEILFFSSGINLVACNFYDICCLHNFAGNDSQSTNQDLNDLLGSSGWELALVTAPSSNANHVLESKLVRFLCQIHQYQIIHELTSDENNLTGPDCYVLFLFS